VKKIFILVVLLLGVIPTFAQEATPEATLEATSEAVTETAIGELSYNSPVIGRISNATFTQSWPLLTASADRIRVVAERVDGNLIPSVSILDEIGNVLSDSYGADETYALSTVNDFTLPAGGSYQIQVTRADGASGVTEGAYRLMVIPLATALDNINNTTVIGPVQYDTPLAGEITPTHWYQRYSLEAPATDFIRIEVQRTSDTLSPQIELLDANGTVVNTGYTDPDKDSAALDYIIPNAGQYFVVVTRERGISGETVGNYELNVILRGSGEGNPNLQGTAGTVELDTPLTGEITDAVWYQDWTLNAETADAFDIEVVRAGSGNLIPMVLLLGGSGQEITRGYPEYTSERALLNRFILPSPGTYTVRVTRNNEQRGETTGTYILNVNLLGSGEGSAALEGTTGAVATGETVQGEVTNARWADSWSYTGTAGERIQIVVNRTGGTLVPYVEIRDTNGQTLSSGYADYSRDFAIIDYTIPSNGEFRITVMRDNQQTGRTTGEYELRVRLPE
jgi:hypothetical protein